jgi:hypothetical protein
MSSIVDQMVSDEDMRKGVSVGTFRWKRGKKMPAMPDLPTRRTSPLLRGWQPFLLSRLETKAESMELVKQCQQDLSMIDGLSYPLTLLFALQQMGVTPHTIDHLVAATNEGNGGTGPQKSNTSVHLDVLVCGASAKAEERLLVDSNYWGEIGHHFSKCSVKLWMVGPEAVEKQDLGPLTTAGLSLEIKKRLKLSKGGKPGSASKSKGSGGEQLKFLLPPNMESEVFIGTTDDFFKVHAELANYYNFDPESNSLRMTLIVGFNPGFGSGIPKLMRSWVKSLTEIASLGIPAIFSQANDYSDLKGELTVLSKTIGVKFVLKPMKNPFSMATVAQGSQVAAKNVGRGWSCGNSYVYGFQGFSAENEQKKLPMESGRLEKALKAIARQLRANDANGGVHGVPADLKIALSEGEVGTLGIPVLTTTASKAKKKKKKKRKKKKKPQLETQKPSENTEEEARADGTDGQGDTKVPPRCNKKGETATTAAAVPKKRETFVRIQIEESDGDVPSDDEGRPEIPIQITPPANRSSASYQHFESCDGFDELE